jgi:phosphoribosylformylglycinamidine synthase
LRCGAIARFSPVMQAVQDFAANGGLVLGICNGFQVLCEAGLLPGALIRNRSLQFRCEHIFLKTLTADSPFTNRIPAGKLLRVPIAHGEGLLFR